MGDVKMLIWQKKKKGRDLCFHVLKPKRGYYLLASSHVITLVCGAVFGCLNVVTVEKRF